MSGCSRSPAPALAGVALCLDGLAGVARVRGERERAVQLLATARRLWDEHRTGPRPGELTEFDGALAALRDDMDADAFAAAWTAGRVMTVDTVVASVRAGHPSPVPAPAGASADSRGLPSRHASARWRS